MNDNSIDFIDNYFIGALSDKDRERFEVRCSTEPDFAREVSFYIAARGIVKQELHLEKKTRFNTLYQQLSASDGQPGKIRSVSWPIYLKLAVAATVLIFFCWYIFWSKPNPQVLAGTYINENLSELSVTMGSGEDTLQMGIEAYNNQKYAEAEKFFSSIANNENYASEAIKHLGVTYLKSGQYEKAIEQFDRLSGIPELYANSGPFYKAVALMQRSEGEDMNEAKILLKKVVAKDLPGKKQAGEWLEGL